MRWSTGFMLAGLLVMGLGFVPIFLAHITFESLESAASFFAVGLLLFLIGFLLRRLSKSLEKSKPTK
jgi:VIT1/CCC1 family predicted Fe2+/Mn2+ transporter